MKPAARKSRKPARSSSENPGFPTFSLGRARSISSWATLRSPQKITGLRCSSRRTCASNARSHAWRKASRASSGWAFGV